MKLKPYLLKQKAKKIGLKIETFLNLSKTASIIAELPSSLGSTKVNSHNRMNAETTFGAHSYIRSGAIESEASIGRFCSFGQNVTIGQSKRTHPIDWASSSHALCTDHKHLPARTIIGNDVWVGDSAVIMEGVTIGHGAIIGRNAIVTKSVEPYQIVAGNPAKSIRYRFDEKIRKNLLESRWWELNLDDLKKLDYKQVALFIEKVDSIKKKAQYKKVLLHRHKILPIKE